MTFDDENKPKSQDFPNIQVPQPSGGEAEAQHDAVAADAGSAEKANAKEAVEHLGNDARQQADSEATQMFNPNDYAQWNSFKDSTQQMPNATQSQERQADESQTYISTVPPVQEAQTEKRKKLSKIVVFAVIAALVFMLFALVGTASDITVSLIAVLAFIPALLSVLGVIFTRKNSKVKGRIGAFAAIGITVVAVVVMGGRMIAYTAHAKAEHKAAIEASCQTLTWPDGDFAKKLPSLTNQKGEVYSDSSDDVSIKLCNATQSSFDSYVKDAKKMGFTVDYDKSSHSFTAKDADGNEIAVFFMEDDEDGNTMSITLDAPKSEDDSKAPDSTDSQQNQESQNQQQSQDTQQQEQPQQQNQQTDSSQVSADFKASMDSYEQFFDQYVEFMKKYKDSGNSVSMLADYTKMLQQYTDTMNKLNAIDQNSLSAADEAYYLEVMGRITQKLASVA